MSDDNKKKLPPHLNHPELRKLWETPKGSREEKVQLEKVFRLMSKEQQDIFRAWCMREREKQYKENN